VEALLVLSFAGFLGFVYEVSVGNIQMAAISGVASLFILLFSVADSLINIRRKLPSNLVENIEKFVSSLDGIEKQLREVRIEIKGVRGDMEYLFYKEEDEGDNGDDSEEKEDDEPTDGSR